MLRTLLKTIQYYFRIPGVDPRCFVLAMRGLPFYLIDFYRTRRQLRNQNPLYIGRVALFLSDRFGAGGLLSGYYCHQDLVIAKCMYRNKPVSHLDVGSRTDGFVFHVAVFREIEVFDIRPVRSGVANIKLIQADLMDRNWSLTGYCDSISCLHALEHFGLGRYGDATDAQGHLRDFENINKTL
jgi:hypothetical protein